MASFVQLPLGNRRAVVRRKARYVAETFRRKCDANSWALEMEPRIDRGQEVIRARPRGLRTLADLIDLHIDDMLEVRKPLRRSKAYTLELLRRQLGTVPFDRVGRDMLVDYGRRRAREGAGPVTVSSELSYINTIVTHAASVHGIAISKEPIELARVALRRLGLVGVPTAIGSVRGAVSNHRSYRDPEQVQQRPEGGYSITSSASRTAIG